MPGRYEVHEWLRSMTEEEKKELFKKFTNQSNVAPLFDQFLEQSYDETHK